MFFNTFNRDIGEERKCEVHNAVRIFLYTYDNKGNLIDNISFISFDS